MQEKVDDDESLNDSGTTDPPEDVLHSILTAR